MFQIAWSRSEVNEGVVYNLLMFPCVLLVFYPAVFGIQNDEDSRILEILFGIPDYKYKVWGVRLLMIYVAIFVILIVFSWLATLLLYPVNLLEMSAQLMKVSEKAAFFFCYAARLLSIFIFKISLVFSIITFREVILQK